MLQHSRLPHSSERVVSLTKQPNLCSRRRAVQCSGVEKLEIASSASLPETLQHCWADLHTRANLERIYYRSGLEPPVRHQPSPPSPPILHEPLRVSSPPTERPQQNRNQQRTADYFANVGDAIRTLRQDIPELFHTDLNYSIYRDDIVFKDPRNRFTGIKNYKLVFWSLRFHGQLFFTKLYVEVKRIWQPTDDVIKMRWTVHGVPRVPWEAQGIFDGVSTYKLDNAGKVYEHCVDNVLLRDPPMVANSPLLAGLNLVPSSPQQQPYPGSWILGQEVYDYSQEVLATVPSLASQNPGCHSDSDGRATSDSTFQHLCARASGGVQLSTVTLPLSCSEGSSSSSLPQGRWDTPQQLWDTVHQAVAAAATVLTTGSLSMTKAGQHSMLQPQLPAGLLLHSQEPDCRSSCLAQTSTSSQGDTRSVTSFGASNQLPSLGQQNHPQVAATGAVFAALHSAAAAAAAGVAGQQQLPPYPVHSSAPQLDPSQSGHMHMLQGVSDRYSSSQGDQPQILVQAQVGDGRARPLSGPFTKSMRLSTHSLGWLPRLPWALRQLLGSWSPSSSSSSFS
ncbi:hypothetical protein QJQ45_014646 [Haematococcus lacustris]|nr:hypothetical protein QJQ45_014646 [Haematococcus lacustris]